MHHFIDRRENPRGKSLGNRQKFLRRAREHIKEIVDKSVMDRSIKGSSISDGVSGETITIPRKSIDEPRLVHKSTGGRYDRVFPGNKKFVVGDKFKRQTKGKTGGKGGKASDTGSGEDGFTFHLTREEFLELLFEGLELPDLIKKELKDSKSFHFRRAGLTTSGTQVNLNLSRTMRNSLGRRIALHRPAKEELDKIETEIDDLITKLRLGQKQTARLAELQEALKKAKARRTVISYIDPVDLRFDTLVKEQLPSSKALVFCLMDVSGSMGEREKELAKRFFLLLNLFLERRYEKVEVVFIQHTHQAKEVDEDTFFYGKETGGTVVSSVLKEMRKTIAERYPREEWNIYAAQASDGDNFGNDSDKCGKILREDLLPLCQYFAYVEIVGNAQERLLNKLDEGGDLWKTYRQIDTEIAHFQTKRVAKPEHIYPVFRELFARRGKTVAI